MQIRFQDCDPLSHLNNGRYLDYFMNAREDHLATYYNLNIYDRLNETGQSWVVARNDIHYRKPAWLMEEVLIRTQVNNYSLKHIEVEMAMFNASGDSLKSLMHSVFIPYNIRSNKVVEHDKVIMSLLKDLRVEGSNNNMEERLAEIEGRL